MLLCAMPGCQSRGTLQAWAQLAGDPARHAPPVGGLPPRLDSPGEGQAGGAAAGGRCACDAAAAFRGAGPKHATALRDHPVILWNAC